MILSAKRQLLAPTVLPWHLKKQKGWWLSRINPLSESRPLLCLQDPLQDQVAEESAHSVPRNRARAGAVSPSMPRATSRGSIPGMRGRERPNHSPAYDPFVPQGPHVRSPCLVNLHILPEMLFLVVFGKSWDLQDLDKLCNC